MRIISSKNINFTSAFGSLSDLPKCTQYYGQYRQFELVSMVFHWRVPAPILWPSLPRAATKTSRIFAPLQFIVFLYLAYKQTIPVDIPPPPRKYVFLLNFFFISIVVVLDWLFVLHLFVCGFTRAVESSIALPFIDKYRRQMKSFKLET